MQTNNQNSTTPAPAEDIEVVPNFACAKNDPEGDIQVDGSCIESESENQTNLNENHGNVGGHGKKMLMTLSVGVFAAATFAVAVAAGASISSSRKTKINSSLMQAKSPKSSKSSKSSKSNCIDFGPIVICDFSCMSGETGILKVNEDESTTVITLVSAQPGDKVKGLNINSELEVEEATCDVIAVGAWGVGGLYGNYTSDHLIYDSSSGGIVEHGDDGEYTEEEKYVLLSTCPLVYDESGVAFTPTDSFGWPQDIEVDVSGVIPLATYLMVYNLIRAVVTALPLTIGASAFVDYTAPGGFWPDDFVGTLLACVNDGGDNCLALVDILEESVEIFTEPTKSTSIAVNAPLIALRDANDPDSIQAIFEAQLSGQSQ